MKLLTPAEKKTDKLLKVWADEKQNGGGGDYAGLGYPATALAGSLVLSETKGYRSKRRPKETGSPRVHAKESKRANSNSVRVNETAERVGDILREQAQQNPNAIQALELKYQRYSLREIAEKMTVSHTTAQRWVEVGFYMVLTEVRHKWKIDGVRC